MTWYYFLVAAGFGLIFGSFFNVAIFRLPRGKPLDSRSRCTECGSVIRWYDNVPVVSFILLRRRCRACGRPISWRYPLVEISTALLFAFMYWWSTEIVPGLLDVPGGRPFQPELLIGLILVSVLIVITGTDLTYGIIPNKAVAVGLMVMTPAVIGCALYRHQPGRIGMAVVASVAGGAFFLVAGLLYGVFFMRSGVEKDAQRGEQVSAEKPEPERGAGISQPAPDTDEGRHTAVAQGQEISTGVGMGDVKLMLVTGLALGYFHWYFVIVHVFLSCVIVGVAVLPLMIFLGKGRKSKIPFGPFLAAGAILTIVWGQALTDLYVRLLK